MDRKLTIYFTSDIHGYFSPTDYANNCRAASGLANCAANFTHDRNTLILDGGDTLQGSPFTYWLYSRTEEKSLIPARLMTLAGYSCITLGIVGAGGIGASLVQCLNSRRWAMVGSFVWGLMILVLIIEYLSTQVRSKIARGE